MKRYFGAAVAALFLVGCAKKDLTPKPLAIATNDNAVMIQTSSDSVEEEEEKETETLDKVTNDPFEIDGVLIDPTDFPTYEDGVPHRLTFYADYKGFSTDTFISVSQPEHGIQSVSFPKRFIETSSDELIQINSDMISIPTPEDRYSVYDYGTLYGLLPENSYARMVPAYGTIGIIDCEATIAGDTPTKEEMTAVAKQYNLILTDLLFEDTSKDGSRVFTTFCATPAPYNPELESDDLNWYGAISIRFTEDGKAQGVYFCHYDQLRESLKYTSYTIQSLRFIEN